MLACDFAIASGNARLGQPEVKLGVTPGFGGSTRLVRRIGRAWANQLLFTGDQLDAERALALGLVNEVVAREALRARVDEIADRITANAPGAVAATKRAARVAAEVDLGTANLYEQEIFGACFATADQKEGMAAFLGKRPAAWSGR
jgi:enoyl-CoA hydratase